MMPRIIDAMATTFVIKTGRQIGTVSVTTKNDDEGTKTMNEIVREHKNKIIEPYKTFTGEES